MRRLRILHISDLHERAPFPGRSVRRARQLELDGEQRGLVLGESFHAALRQLPGPIDLVCFTGDLADWGRPEEYSYATQRIDKILTTLAVPRTNFFAVPGNHDVQRNLHAAAWKGIRKWLSETHLTHQLGRWLRGAAEPPRGLKSRWREELLARTDAFWTWLAHFRGTDLRSQPSLGYRQTLTLAGINAPIHVLGLDSAWLCGGDDDQGHIVVTEEQLLSRVRDGEKALGGFRLALTHHPLDHLADHHGVRRLLSTNADLLLHGHQHSPLAMTIDEPGASLRIFASGCLMEGDEGKDWPNGFQLIEIDVVARTGTIRFHKWSERGFWTPGSDIYKDAPGGSLSWSYSGENEVRDLVTESIQNIDAEARQLLIDMGRSVRPFPVPISFVRSSQPNSSTEHRRLHALLRDLRRRGLLQPAEGGKWEAGKHAELTVIGRYAIASLNLAGGVGACAVTSGRNEGAKKDDVPPAAAKPGSGIPLLPSVVSPHSSTAFFHDRMCDAFPGKFGPHRIEEVAQCIARLRTLLKKPLTFDRYAPIWEVGFGTSAVSSLTIVSATTVKLGHYRLRPRKLLGYRSSSYWKDFVLLYWEAEPPTGLYPPETESELLERVHKYGKAQEEYGVQGKRLFTRQEHDDGSAIVNGRPKRISSQLEVRFLAPGVTALVAQWSPLNDSQHDSKREQLMRRLSGEAQEDRFIEWTEGLPRHRREHG